MIVNVFLLVPYPPDVVETQMSDFACAVLAILNLNGGPPI